MLRGPGPSPRVAGHRALGHWPGATVAGRRLASPHVCCGWLPTWLPANSLAVLMFERSNGCVRCSREHGRAVPEPAGVITAIRSDALPTAHYVQIADSALPADVSMTAGSVRRLLGSACVARSSP